MITQDYRLYFFRSFFLLNWSRLVYVYAWYPSAAAAAFARISKDWLRGLATPRVYFQMSCKSQFRAFFANAWRARYHPGDNNWAFVKKTNSFFTDLLQDSGGGEGACRCRKDQTHWCGWSHCHRERRSVRSRGHETQSRRLQAIWRSSYTFSRFRGPTKGEIPYI